MEAGSWTGARAFGEIAKARPSEQFGRYKKVRQKEILARALDLMDALGDKLLNMDARDLALPMG